MGGPHLIWSQTKPQVSDHDSLSEGERMGQLLDRAALLTRSQMITIFAKSNSAQPYFGAMQPFFR